MSIRSTLERRAKSAALLSSSRSLSSTLPLALCLVIGFAAVATAQPTVVTVEAPSSGEVIVTWDGDIDPTTGADVGNYQVFDTLTPATIFGVDEITVVGATSTLTLADFLAAGRNYTVRTLNIQALGGGPGSPLATATFDYPSAPTSTPIADIQANPAGFQGQTVTVEGQVYVPSNYRGATISGYIQDGSGRGINLFGTEADDPLLQNTGNVVRVTGTVDLFFTTVEILDITSIELVSSGNPPLTPMQLSTGAAASTQWEGTFIQVTAPIVSQEVGGPGINYTVDDGSGAIVVRAVDTLGAATFSNGQTITARGAGGQFGTDFQLNVGQPADIFLGGGGPDTTPPTVVGASASAATSVTVSFSEAIDAVTGGNASNYSLFPTGSPGSPLSVSSVSISGSNATLSLGSSLVDQTGYTVQVTGVEDLAGNVIAGSNSTTFTYSEVSATPIADIQANPTSFQGQTVTVEGQVYVPSNYRGGTISGYIQDGSGRGINIFGSEADDPRLQDTSNIVRVTGTVDIFFSTVEILDLTSIELLSSGNAPLSPTQLSTGAAASAQWEGTFIEVTAPIVSQAVGGPGVNYTVDDGSGPVVVRVVDTLGAATFSNGTTITARGAGGLFQSDFQVNVGQASDVFLDGGGTDTTPPTVISAGALNDTQVQVAFSEAVDATSAQVVGNYSVFRTGSPSNPITVTAAVAAGASVTLTLGSSLQDGLDYTVEVTGVEDVAGNTIAGNNSAAFVYSESGVIPIATIQADPDFWEGREVTVQGEVYIPTDYRGSTPNGYIQDDSGRGINIFGTGAGGAATERVGNVVRVTGEIELFFTTVEVSNVSELVLISSGAPTLKPRRLDIAQAASSQWEGTFIEISGEVQARSETGTPPSAVNYTLEEDGVFVDVRVVLAVGAPSFSTADTIYARGAGGRFQDTFQVLVGTAGDISSTPFPDTGPPGILRAFFSGSDQITVEFDEEVTQATAENADNYTIRDQLGNTVDVVNAFLQGGGRVLLTLATAVDPDDQWTVSVINVADLLGNEIPAGAPVTAQVGAPPVEDVALDGPARTFLPREGERYPLTMLIPENIASGGGFQAEVLLRVFDLHGRLKTTLYDSRFENADLDFSDTEHTVRWDGRDEFLERVPAGAYIAHMQVFERRTGKKHELQMPVVVATRLER